MSQPVYEAPQVLMSANGKDVFVISDLHLAAGTNSNSNYDGTENFFSDHAFIRFIDHLIAGQSAPGHLLVINGDFIDFLRIKNIPETDTAFINWKQALEEAGISKTEAELRRSVSKKERDYGLKTDDYKSIWKLLVCALGHQVLFEALANWLAHGNRLVIVKGNHDLEWYWPTVQKSLCVLLEKFAKTLPRTGGSLETLITFVDDVLLIDDEIFVKHGHNYDNFTTVNGPAVLEKGTELNLPFGSFFNRYLINIIELSYPHIDDVRPRQKILPLLLQERFPLAIKLLFHYLPFSLRVIPKGKFLYAFRFLLQFVVIIVLPLAITIFAISKTIELPRVRDATGIGKLILSQVKNLAFLSLSYFFGRLQSMLQLTAPAGLYPYAEEVFRQNPQVRYVVFGHTHNPSQISYQEGAKKYYNTGTWIPVFQTTAGEVRADKVYSFLHVPASATELPRLLCWNDDAQRIEPLVLIDRK